MKITINEDGRKIDVDFENDLIISEADPTGTTAVTIESPHIQSGNAVMTFHRTLSYIALTGTERKVVEEFINKLIKQRPYPPHTIVVNDQINRIYGENKQ